PELHHAVGLVRGARAHAQAVLRRMHVRSPERSQHMGDLAHLRVLRAEDEDGALVDHRARLPQAACRSPRARRYRTAVAWTSSLNAGSASALMTSSVLGGAPFGNMAG